ncbi:hypothetical protein SUGI_0601230 [Cryptomeria japonica]|nr:hypothetical protein SUGI_0601230 [Cryptomeria japonica]
MISNCRTVESQEDFDLILTIETLTVRNPIRFLTVFEAESSNDFRYSRKNFQVVCTRQRIPQTLDIFPRSFRHGVEIQP